VNFIEERIIEYCVANSSFKNELLDELERETYLKTLAPQMISSKIQGQFLHFMIQLLKPTKVLEIGTFTGYSAFCMALALQDKAQLISIESNPEYAYIFQKYKNLLKLDNIDHRIGNALEIIPTLSDDIDFIFMDGSKKEYPQYYDLLLPKLSTHGVMLVDNVLWYGKVLESNVPSKQVERKSKWAIHPPQGPSVEEVLRNFNLKLKEDEKTNNFLLPIRDGIHCIIKK